MTDIQYSGPITVGSESRARAAAEEAAAVDQARAREDEAKALARQVAAQENINSRMRVEATTVPADVSVTIRDGKQVVEARSVATTGSSQPAAFQPTESIIATAKSANGFNLRVSGSDITPDTIVTVGGMETTVAAAAALGLLKRDANGTWVDAQGVNSLGTPEQNTQRSKENETQESESGEPPVEMLDSPEAEQTLTQYATFGNGTNRADMVVNFQSVINGKGFDADALSNIAARMGLPAETVASQAQEVFAAFRRQADAAVGHNAQAVWDWAQSHAPTELRAAMERQFMRGTTDGLKALASRYFETLDQHNPEMILNSQDAKARGIRMEPDGRITVRLANGVRTTWRQAVRMGAIKPHHT